MRTDSVHKHFLGVHYYRVGEVAKLEGFGLTLWARVGDIWKIFPGRA